MVTNEDKIDIVLKILADLERRVSANYIFNKVDRKKINSIHELTQILDKLESESAITSELETTVFAKSGRVKVYKLSFDIKSSISKGETYKIHQFKKKNPITISNVIAMLAIATTVFFTLKNNKLENQLENLKIENTKLKDSISLQIKTGK